MTETGLMRDKKKTAIETPPNAVLYCQPHRTTPSGEKEK